MARSTWRFLLILLLAPVLGKAAFADSELFFPRISFGSDELTGLAIVNPNTADAQVTLTAYGADGSPLSGDNFSNPVQITVEAGRQYADVTAAIFGSGPDPATVGWVKAVSESNDLAGFFLFLTLDLRVFDGADLPETARVVVFNEAKLGDGFSTELNLVNPGSAPASVTLRLLGGADEVSKQLMLPALGAARLDAAEFFGVEPESTDDALYVQAESESEILGFEFVRGPGDLLGLNAKSAAERLNTMNFPQLAVLGVFESELQLVNYADETAILTLTAHRPDGSPYDQADLLNNPVNLALRGGESRREDLAELFGFFGEAGLDGWLEVVSSSDAVNGSMSYAIPSANSLASVASIAQASQRAVFSHIATTQGFFTGVAALNAAGLTANIQITALRRDGGSLGSYSTALLPGQRISRLITEIIPGAADQSGGMIFVTSDIPVYLTSLFGSLETGVLANIPPQQVPDEFQPASVTAAAELEPALAILSPAAAQQFSLQGGVGTPEWSVNGVPGGNAVVGTVSPSGQYLAPAIIPDDLPVSVLAELAGSLVGASVDILSAQDFLSDLGLVQSVAYLEGAQRVYFSELTGLAGAGRGEASRGVAISSRLREADGGTLSTVAEFDGEEIPKIISFTAQDGQEYLLAAARTSGRVLRVDPRTGGVTEVAAGLVEPTALVLDPVEGELLVAEAEQVSSVPADQLNLGLASAPPAVQGGAPRPSKVFSSSSRGRVTVDQCTGNAYISLREEGRILEYSRLTGAFRSLADGLQDPGQPLGVYRRGLGCPDTFHLLVPERGTQSILLLVPSKGVLRPWLSLAGVQDLTFIPSGSPVAPQGGVLAASLEGSVGRLSLIPLPDLYRGRGVNPPSRPERSACSLTQVTETRGEAVQAASVSGDGSRLIVVAAADFTGENPDGGLEIFAFQRGVDGVKQLTELPAGAQVEDVAVNRGGDRIIFRSDARLTAGAPRGTHLYLLDTTRSEYTLLARDQDTAAAIDLAGQRVVFASRNDPLGGNPDGNPEIFLADADAGLSQITQTESAVNLTPAISGDGAKIVFRSTADLSRGNPARAMAVFLYDTVEESVALVGVEDQEPREVPSTALLIDGDGDRVLFPSKLDLTGEMPAADENLYFAELRGGTTVKILPADSGTRWLSLTADGRFLSVASRSNPAGENRDRNREVFLFDLDGGGAAQITRSRNVTNSQPRLSSEGGVGTLLSEADYTGENEDRNKEVFRLICTLPEGGSNP